MKKFSALLLFVMLTGSLNASHVVGGQISYEHESLDLYRINAYLIYDGEGLQSSPPSSIGVCFFDTCGFINGNASLNLQTLPGKPSPLGGILIPNSDICVMDSLITSRYYVVHYSEIVNLASNCDEMVIRINTACCKTITDNLSESENMIVTARLNTKYNANSQPAYDVLELMRPMCKSEKAFFAPFQTEKDGDSLYFSLIPVKKGDCFSVSDYSYHTGFNPTHPMTTQSGYNLDPENGDVSFTAIKSEVSSINILVEEFRQDPLTNTYYRVGSFETNFVHHIVDSCSRQAENWSFKQDTILAQCGDSLVVLFAEKPIIHSSINSTDFRLTGPDSTTLPIINAGYDSNYSYSDSVYLSFFLPIQDSGIYTLWTKTGNDGNSLINVCGSEINGDSVYIHSTFCDIGIDEHKLSKSFSLYPNPVGKELTLENVEKGSTIKIMDMQGAVLDSYKKSTEAETLLTLPLFYFKKGMYIISIENAKGFISQQKFCKK